MAAYLVTVFLSSFLLFQVQPLIGRYILPWFGGSPAVWTTCMLFFQAMLLAGYGYAHALTGAGRKRQGYLHLALLAVSLAFLPIAPSASHWRTGTAEFPVGNILMLLLTNIGMPYLVLSATAPLIQHWFVRSFPGRSPYRLYALSNTASLLALVSYPFLVEPSLALGQQVASWSWGYFAFVICCAWCALRPAAPGAAPEAAAGAASGAAPGDVVPGQGPGLPPSLPLSKEPVLLWLALSACGSAALLAATNQLCQEVAVVPFLWVAPLTLYLATFIICFNNDRGYRRGLWLALFVAAAVPACWLLQARTSAPLPVQLLVFLALLFACCMTCHGELSRARPRSEHLTAYYLTMSVGGVLGGLFVALVAPLAFRGYWELPIVTTSNVLVLGLAWRRDGIAGPAQRRRLAGLGVLFAGLLFFTVRYVGGQDPGTLAKSRNFYGVLKVVQSYDQRGPLRYLVNGRVLHGYQYTDPVMRRFPTSYYSPGSGVGLALRYHPRRSAPTSAGRTLRVGVVGLGAGTLATYGQAGDTFRFYEINSEVIRFADQCFTFRRDSAARIETVPGDARIELEAELARPPVQQFDVLVVDAFTSDSIPVHLLTRECFAIYRAHLKPDGLLLIHVTNHFLDLVPVVQAHARQLGLQAVIVKSGKQETGSSESTWMILTGNQPFLNRGEVSSRIATGNGATKALRPWTDDFISLWQIVKW